MKGEGFKLEVDFLYRTWPGYVAFVAALVWKFTMKTCIATVVYNPVLGVTIVMFIGVAMYTMWTMTRASSEEEYQDVGGGAVVAVLLLLSLWLALFCEEG